MRVELEKEFVAEAAHTNGLPLHGHSFRIGIVAYGEVDPGVGWLVDFGDLKAAFAPIYAQIDHTCLDDVDGMEDTSVTGLRAWILERLKPTLDCLKDVRVSIAGDGVFRPVTLPADGARNLPERTRFSFEAAQSLPNLPGNHPCRALHGHTYWIEVGGGDPASLHEPLRALYDVLDHRYLNDIEGLEEATSERLAQWIWNRLNKTVDDLAVVVVQETQTSRCAYYGE